MFEAGSKEGGVEATEMETWDLVEVRGVCAGSNGRQEYAAGLRLTLPSQAGRGK